MHFYVTRLFSKKIVLGIYSMSSFDELATSWISYCQCQVYKVFKSSLHEIRRQRGDEINDKKCG